MKRLVYLSAFLSPYRSGAEAMAEEVARRLEGDYDITIITGRYSRSLPRRETFGSRVTVLRVGLGLPIDKWLYPFLAPLTLRRLKPDIVHAVLETFAGLALFFCRCRAKNILTLQTLNRSFLKGMILRSPAIVTAISTALVDIARVHGRTDVVLIPNGIDADAIHRAIHAHPKIRGRLLFVGRLEPMKGVDVLLRAFAHALPTLHEAARLVLVGSGSQGKRLHALAQTLGISHRIDFLGRLTGDELMEEFAKAEIFVGLSRSEALGNVFLEASAAGCAVVATRTGGIVDIVDDGRTGVLVAPEDHVAAADAIRALLSDDARRCAMATEGQRKAASFSWDAIAAQYRRLYSALERH